MIYLYDSTETNFTYNGRPLPLAYNVIVEYTINDSYFVTFTHPLDQREVYKEIEKDSIIKVHTPDGMQPMRIVDRTKLMDGIEVEAWPLFYADMRHKLVKPLALRSATGQTALTTFVNNLIINTPFTFSSNITDSHDYTTQSSEDAENDPGGLFDALDVFKDIVKRWNGELSINGYDIRVLSRLGQNTDALLYEKKNISEFTDEESIQGVVTRLHGKAEWEEEVESDIEGETPEPIKHSITTTVDSPLINAYSGIIYEKQYTNNDMKTEAQLRSWLNLKFTTDNIDKPSRSISVGTNIVDDTEINIGDTLVLKYIKHDVDVEIRMIGYKYDGFANRYIEVELGDAKETYIGNVQNTINDSRESLAGQTKKQIETIMNDLGEKMIYSVNEPSGNFREGDTWFDQQGGMYFWDADAGMWIDHPYNKNKHVVADQIAALETDVDQAKQAATDAGQRATDALTQAGTSGDLAQTASEAAQRAETSAAAAGNKAADAVIKATDAVTKADDAIQNIDTFRPLVNDAVAKADDAVAQAGSAITQAQDATQNVNTFRPLVNDAKAKADEAIGKANDIPITIDNIINTKGLVAGDWVTSQIDSATGEINYDLTSVKGSIPDVIMGVEWAKISSPKLSRTDYIKEFASLADYQLKTAEYDLSIDGLSASIQSVATNKLDASAFATFKANDYDVTVDGITGKLSAVETNKLDSGTFTTFKENDYDVTVDGVTSRLTSVETDKLDTGIFDTFKANDYQMTVDGLKMSLASIDGAIAPIVLGVEWARKPSPTLTRTDETQENVRMDDYRQQTAEFDFTLSGFGQTLSSLETKKMDNATFTTFKTGEYKNAIDGITGRLTSVETEKLAAYEFQTFKANDYQMTVDGLSGRLTTVENNKTDQADFESFKTNEYQVTVGGIETRLTSAETGKLDSGTFTTFKENDYDVTVDGLETRLTSVETDKLDSGTFTTFKTNDYQVTINGINGSIQSLNSNKMDHADFIEFKTNEYQMTVDGLDMALTSVSGAIPTIILGVSWSRGDNPGMERTNDAATMDLSNYDSPDYIMGVEWERAEDPGMERIRDVAELASSKDFETLLADYNFNASGWSATNTYIKDNQTSINSLISNADGWSQTISYVDDNQTAINETISQVDYYKQTILGADGENIAQLVMTDRSFITRISEIENRTEDIILGVEWERVESPRMVRTGYMEDWASSQISQLSDNINLKVSKGDVVSQINIEAGRTLVQTGKLYLNADSVVFSGSAFIPSAAITSLTADKITTGQLDASKVKVVNIDANQITSNASNFVRTNWNAAAGGAVQINGSGILSTAADGSQTYIQNGITGTRNPDGATIGQIGYINTGTIATYSIRTSWGSHFELRQRSNASTEYVMLRAENGATNFFINARNGIYLNTSNSGGRVNIDSEVRILNGNRLFLENARIVNPYGIFLNHGGEFYTLSSGGSTRLGFGSELQFRQGATLNNVGTQKMMIDSTRVYFYQDINMGGHTIKEQSDKRLKTNIQASRADDLEKISRIEYVNFEWKDRGKDDFGFIAQQVMEVAPEIIGLESDGYLAYSMQAYTHLIGHAVQQLNTKVDDEVSQLKTKIKALEKEIEGLKNAS